MEVRSEDVQWGTRKNFEGQLKRALGSFLAIVQIGETPPRAPTDAIVLVGFSEDSERQLSARVERSEWRKQPNRFSNYGCGSVSGIVRREGDHWTAKLTPDR